MTSYYDQADAVDREAHEKHQRTKLADPYTDIYPALLSANDIRRYVNTTGMISPFHDNDKQLKQAAYSVKLLGKCVYWDDEGKKQEFNVREKEEFILKRNSIAFVSLEPRFRVPYYIALRFNLQISHIHRGLLLGTGPLIDPGFDGRLAVPLHNLTMNDYVLRGGDDLIWIEFTKINIDKKSLKGSVIDDYVPFEPEKNIRDINDYLHKAYHGHPIQSSLSEIQGLAERANDKITTITWAGVLAVVALIVAIVMPGLQLVTDSNNYVKGAKELYTKGIDERDERIRKLEEKIAMLEKKMEMKE
jgi:deoxycytidine triphosphate deaminase